MLSPRGVSVCEETKPAEMEHVESEAGMVAVTMGNSLQGTHPSDGPPVTWTLRRERCKRHGARKTSPRNEEG